MLNRDIKAKGMYSFKASKITFECETEVPWTLDGEFGGRTREAVIVNENKSVTIAVKNS